MRANVFLLALAVPACAVDASETSTAEFALFDGFTTSYTAKNGHTYRMSCGSAQAYVVPGEAGVAVVCRGKNEIETQKRDDFEASVKKLRDGMNEAAPEINKALEAAAKPAKPALKITCNFPPVAGDKPGVDVSKVPEKPKSVVGLRPDIYQYGSLGGYENEKGIGVYAYYFGEVDPKSVGPLEFVPKPTWKRITYRAVAEWTCLVTGQSDAFNLTEIPSSYPANINCPFPTTTDSAKTMSCEKASSASVTIGATVTFPGTTQSIMVKFGESVTMGIDFSHDNQPVFLRDNNTTKLRAGSKVTISLKSAKIDSLEQQITLGGEYEGSGLVMSLGTSKELGIGRGASNYFVTTKDLTHEELVKELYKKYALIAGLGAVVASMDDNTAKVGALFKESVRFYEPRRRSLQVEPAETESCSPVERPMTITTLTATDPSLRRDPLVCSGQITDADHDGREDDADNCPSIANTDQHDTDGDLRGDACDPDEDGDGVPDDVDTCSLDQDAQQTDSDGDGLGDACDPCTACGDADADGVADLFDNCPALENVDQLDSNHDGMGDACDWDNDGDGIPDHLDGCPGICEDTTPPTLTPTTSQLADQLSPS